jgi:hypothetical protein
MAVKFAESAGTKLGQRAADLMTTAPVAFCAAGLVVWLADVGFGTGWARLSGWVARQQPAQLLAWAVAGLLVVVATGSVVRQCVPPSTRLLEGYWPQPLRRVGDVLSGRAWAKRVAAVETVRRLSPSMDDPDVSPADQRLFVRQDALRSRVPSRRAWTLPTRLGNILRTAETRPFDKYGLDPVKLWPVVWLVVPENVRQELTGARTRLDSAVAGLLWALLGVALGVVAWWAAPVALVATWTAYRVWVLPAAAVYADLLEASFDVHRFDLYLALRFTCPEDSAAEQLAGTRLTNFVWRGGDETHRFDHSREHGAEEGSR